MSSMFGYPAVGRLSYNKKHPNNEKCWIKPLVMVTFYLKPSEVEKGKSFSFAIQNFHLHYVL